MAQKVKKNTTATTKQKSRQKTFLSLADLGFKTVTSGTAVRCVNISATDATESNVVKLFNCFNVVNGHKNKQNPRASFPIK